MRHASSSARSFPRFALGALLALGTLSSAHPRSPTTHVVQLERNRFTPAEIRVTRGDTIRFVNGLGGPHNVQFMAESISVAAQERLNGAMKDRVMSLTSPMFIIEGEAWIFVVPALAPGRYPFLCSPHWASMRGALTVGALRRGPKDRS